MAILIEEVNQAVLTLGSFFQSDELPNVDRDDLLSVLGGIKLFPKSASSDGSGLELRGLIFTSIGITAHGISLTGDSSYRLEVNPDEGVDFERFDIRCESLADLVHTPILAVSWEYRKHNTIYGDSQYVTIVTLTTAKGVMEMEWTEENIGTNEPSVILSEL